MSINTLRDVGLTVAGFAIGTLATTLLLKKHFETKAEESIRELRVIHQKKRQEFDKVLSEKDSEIEQLTISRKLLADKLLEASKNIEIEDDHGYGTDFPTSTIEDDLEEEKRKKDPDPNDASHWSEEEGYNKFRNEELRKFREKPSLSEVVDYYKYGSENKKSESVDEKESQSINESEVDQMPAEDNYMEEEAYNESLQPKTDEAYVISEQEYIEDRPEYSKIPIEYYTEEEVLVDDGGEIIDDVDKIVGKGTLEKFGYKTGSEDVVFARNEMMGADFEIERIHGSIGD